MSFSLRSPYNYGNPVSRGRGAGLSYGDNLEVAATGGLLFNQKLQKANAQRDSYYRNQQAIQSANDASNAYDKYNTQLAEQHDQEEGVRAKALASVDSAYGAPSREAAIQNTYDARLKDSMAGITQNYTYGSQQSGLADASKGRLGSSTDAEHQAALRNSLQMSTAAATADAQGNAQDMRNNDYNQHQSLRNAILAGDPQSAAQYQTMAAQSNAQAGQLAQRSQFVDQNRYLGQQYGNIQSQQLGGYAQSGANYVNSGALNPYFQQRGGSQAYYGNGYGG